MDDGTFPALLKTLSDPSEEVRVHIRTVEVLGSMVTRSCTGHQT